MSVGRGRLSRRGRCWDVWAAAYLIGGGCSDDSFIDFRAGVIALGREWYERVLASPTDWLTIPRYDKRRPRTTTARCSPSR
ncbi:DUF4240 domain-containing protein [Micromonospora arida]|uniref:DUF4240 domain-containing protein n=1 Tax=Micromonospora arida TaxID=2203715 RepID=UPI0033C128D7